MQNPELMSLSTVQENFLDVFTQQRQTKLEKTGFGSSGKSLLNEYVLIAGCSELSKWFDQVSRCMPKKKKDYEI
jgi:hypothetical protein